MDLEAQSLLRPYLLPHERILWSGRPKQGLTFRFEDLWLVPLSLAFAGIAAAWVSTLTTLGREAPLDPFFTLHGLIVPPAAVYFVAGRFLHDAWARGRTVYAVTDRRLLFLRAGLFGRFRSLEIGYLPLFEYEEHRDSRGTLLFDIDEDQSAWWWRNNSTVSSWAPALSRAPRFDRIEQPRYVYDLISREAERRRREQFGEQRGPRDFIG